MDRRIGPTSDILKPGYSGCHCCLTNWGFVDGYSTNYTSSRGMFPLCVDCYMEFSPDERLAFHRELLDEWGEQENKNEYWSNLKHEILSKNIPHKRKTIIVSKEIIQTFEEFSMYIVTFTRKKMFKTISIKTMYQIYYKNMYAGNIYPGSASSINELFKDFIKQERLNILLDS